MDSISHSPYVPYDVDVGVYEVGNGGVLVPFEYSGWKDEALSWKQTCYLHGGLNPTLTYRLSGPDALQLLSDVSVNSLKKFEIGASKHLVMCNDRGHIMSHGMCLRTGEQDFITYWLAPYLPYFVESSNYSYDVVGEDVTGSVFLFQVAGPRSLEVLENATREDLHDIRFLRHRPSQIVGAAADGSDAKVNILRVGMAGTLAYEVHGTIEDARTVYEAILAAGEPFAIRRLSRIGYILNHAENGFVQSGSHFVRGWAEDEGFMRYQRDSGWGARQPGSAPVLRGSMGSDVTARYLTPFDAGWGHIVKLDHEFIGRAALEPLMADPPRSIASFVWNAEDILNVYASQLKPGEEFMFMSFPLETEYFRRRGRNHFADVILKDGERVGMSFGRTYSYYYRDMISIGPIAPEHNQIGNAVSIRWGDEGTRQKEIRATVARFPYLDLPRNEEIDVETIPRLPPPS